ncbi:2TM domain-containing protein [Phocaeicola dorei]|nr:2TM domain-containing protein [Phocaeicola dorei]
MKTNQNNKKTVPTQEQIEVVCRQRARHFWNWLTWSLVYYVVINLFLIAINWFTSPHYWWVLWVIAGWGNQLADDSHREKHQILINHKLKRKKQYGRKKIE